MSNGMPNINIEFKTTADSAVKRSKGGILAVMVLETFTTKSKKSAVDEASFSEKAITIPTILTLTSPQEIPEFLTDENKEYIKRAFIGGQNQIKSVKVIVTDTVANGLALVESTTFNYLCGPHNLTVENTSEIADLIKDMRDYKNIKVKAVLPHCPSNHEGIINFTTDNIKISDTKTLNAGAFCSRIASILVGTPHNVSATYCVLSDVLDVPKFTKAQLDTKVNDGEFFIFHDGEKIKTSRAVNSLVTIQAPKTQDYKYIKIIDILDLIFTDVRRTLEDNYIGKFANNYDNKCTLINAIKSYLEGLRFSGFLDDVIEVLINIEQQKEYLREQGLDVSNMKDLDIKKANTGTVVFIKANIKVLNAIEDISIEFYI